MDAQGLKHPAKARDFAADLQGKVAVVSVELSAVLLRLRTMTARGEWVDPEDAASLSAAGSLLDDTIHHLRAIHDL